MAWPVNFLNFWKSRPNSCCTSKPTKKIEACGLERGARNFFEAAKWSLLGILFLYVFFVSLIQGITSHSIAKWFIVPITQWQYLYDRFDYHFPRRNVLMERILKTLTRHTQQLIPCVCVRIQLIVWNESASHFFVLCVLVLTSLRIHICCFQICCKHIWTHIYCSAF